VGLASFVRRQAIRVIEVSHCDRRTRRNNGKSDTLDAETAARSVLAGIATAVPKTADGAAEMVRQIKVARDTAVKAKTAAIITLKTLIVNAPSELREVLEPLTDRKLIDRCARLLPGGTIADTTASTKHALRALATRWLGLSTEIEAHDGVLDTITRGAAPTLREAFGIGPDSAAEMMIVLGDNPTRIRSEAAFAKLCGACPIPASSGLTNRHRLFRGGHRQANAALYRIVTVRMRWHQPTMDYVARRTIEGLSKKDIIRCLKRFVAREIYHAVIGDHRSRTADVPAA
jgi:transposase